MRLAIALLVVAAAPLFGREKPEAIPDGAIARLGWSAFRCDYPLKASYYSADGRSVIGCTHEGISVWDSVTGRLLRRFPIADPAQTSTLNLWDLPHAHDWFAHNAVKKTVACAGFSNNRGHIRNWDLATGKLLFERETEFCDKMEWTPDGTRLVVGRHMLFGNPKARVRCLSVFAATGDVLRDIPLASDDAIRYGNAFKVIDDKRILSIDSGKNDKPQIIDLETGAVLRELDWERPGSDLVLGASRDGRKLAVPSTDGLTVYDAADGRKIREIELDRKELSRLYFSPDGNRLYVSGIGAGFDVASGAAIFGKGVPGCYDTDGISPDGNRLLRRFPGSFHQIDARTGKPTSLPPGPFGPSTVVWFPDNRTILTRSVDESTWTVWNTGGVLKRRFAADDEPNYDETFRPIASLSADGRELTDSVYCGSTSLWDTATGKLRKKFLESEHKKVVITNFALDGESRRLLSHFHADSEKEGEDCHAFDWYNLETEKRVGGFHMNLPPDYRPKSLGKSIAVELDEKRVFQWQRLDPDLFALRLFRYSDGRPFRRLEHGESRPESLAVDPRGELAITRATTQSRLRIGDDSVDFTPTVPQVFHLWDLLAEREIARWEAPGLELAAALAPGGRYVVHAVDRESFAVFDPYVSRKAVRTFKVPARVESFSFSPDGSRLVAVLGDTTMAVYDSSAWDMGIRKSLEARKPADWKPLWDALAGEPPRAYEAARLLSLAADDAVALLRANLPPAAKVGGDTLNALLDDLDATRYTARERASRELARLGPRAESALRKRLEAKPNAEVKSRVEKLLDGIEDRRCDPETLRELRAVRVLDWIGSAAARELLGTWAKGDAKAPVTEAARAVSK